MKKGAKNAASPADSSKKAAKKVAAKVKATKKPVAVVLNQDGVVAGPDEVRDELDPGDETQRRFRYQHAYGVVLLIGSFRGLLPYKNIWCEHHDDFLAQHNGVFDSYQVKTRVPENGPWELTTDGFIAAIKKFGLLECRFPGKIGRFKFVSNTRTSDSTAESKIHRAPNHLLTAVTGAKALEELKEPFLTALQELAQSCDITNECLFQVLNKTDLIVGPGLDDFEAVLSIDHLARVEHCSTLVPSHINAIRDELIQKIHDASSNRVDDPSKHWCCINGPPRSDPRLLAKQLPVTLVAEVVQQRRPVPFRFSPIATLTDERLTNNNLSTFEKKLLRGGLQPQMETMRRRTVSAEQHLLEMAVRKPQEIQNVRNQLEVYVQGVCDDASLQASASGEVSGPEMLRKVQQKLEKTADEQPDLVFNQPYDCLMGMAGLLTEACTVWWSSHFDPKEVTP
jgi:hypothetical protein